MDLFISLEELKELNPESYILVYCLSKQKIPVQHIPGSCIFTFDDDPDTVIATARTLQISENVTIICHGTGERMECSTKAY